MARNLYAAVKCVLFLVMGLVSDSSSSNIVNTFFYMSFNPYALFLREWIVQAGISWNYI